MPHPPPPGPYLSTHRRTSVKVNTHSQHQPKHDTRPTNQPPYTYSPPHASLHSGPSLTLSVASTFAPALTSSLAMSNTPARTAAQALAGPPWPHSPTLHVPFILTCTYRTHSAPHHKPTPAQVTSIFISGYQELHQPSPHALTLPFLTLSVATTLARVDQQPCDVQQPACTAAQALAASPPTHTHTLATLPYPA
jgi:hypothetical protein